MTMKNIALLTSLACIVLIGCRTVNLDKKTPPGSVPPTATTAPAANRSAETGSQLGVSRSAHGSFATPAAARGNTPNRVGSGILSAFKKAYQAKGAPRIAIFFNRELSDEVRQWATESRYVVTGNINSVEASKVTVRRTGRETSIVGKPAKLAGGQGSVYEQKHIGQEQRPSALEDWTWQYEASFLWPFLSVNAKLIDRATILRLAAASGKQGDAHDLPSVKKIEIKALRDKADIFLELLVRRNTKASVGYEFYATAKEVQTGRILAMTTSLRWQQADMDLMMPPKYVATPDGFKRAREGDFPRLDLVSAKLAIDVMVGLTNIWGSKN